MDREDIQRFEAILEDAKREGWDYVRTWNEFKVLIIQWLIRPPFNLHRDGIEVELVSDLMMDPEEGLIRGGIGYEHLNFRALNEVRAKLYKHYHQPLDRFGTLATRV